MAGHADAVCTPRQPNIGRLGLPHGPSGEKVAVVTVDDCDTAVAVRFGGFVGNYSCAAQGTQSGSKKSLDLTGPLLLGGVPNLPEDFPVQNRQFVGCMRNLSVDGRNVDMASFIANNGTRAGCAAQRNFCEGTWCQNGGSCVSRWNTYSCECPLRFGGKNCELRAQRVDAACLCGGEQPREAEVAQVRLSPLDSTGPALLQVGRKPAGGHGAAATPAVPVLAATGLAPPCQGKQLQHCPCLAPQGQKQACVPGVDPIPSPSDQGQLQG
ncbi:Cadherin EGF LAG seven-pass G-type receptor 1 [Galemys pyrenaicus]|uniref:Cadherin EGF LAG seven-pass G-type receptor 1 n=1 Tax=Galemys pyrenaicus TaxID=202257 RepID=A0A8J6AXF7_GALPY|nr:Cadherin EGF LAG seven-pass G-type receptor 1 [Galemys pyrenaicus]